MIDPDDFRSDDGFCHRIDWIPDVGRDVVIRTVSNPPEEFVARVVPAWDHVFTGIGCEVGYKTRGGRYVSAADMRQWKYL